MKGDARYELVEKIASGSFATVYRAKDLELGREVAVKQIHQQFLDDPKQLERYWQEAQLLASLHHPNIVTIFDLVREKGWLIMELLQGNLGQRNSDRAMDLTSLRTVVAHSLRALKFLHEHGIVHGDIKPSNLMIDRRKRVKIGDFGLARRVADDEGSLIKGTTKYMAPEVVSDEFGEVGPASDLYSLGFTAYDLMCGKNFDSLFPGLNAFGRDKQVAWMMWHAAPDRRLPEIHRVLEGVPDDLAKVVTKLTAKKQSERYQSADQALADLKIDLKIVNKGEEGHDGAPPVNADAKRRRLLIIGAFSFSVCMTLGMLLWPTNSEPPPRPTNKAGVIRRIFLDTDEVELIDAEGAPESLKLPPKPTIYLTNTRQNILLRDLQAGDHLKIEKDPLGKAAGGVRYVISRPVDSRGRVARVDASSRLLVMSVEDGAVRGELPLTVPPRVEMLLNGDKFEDLAQIEPDDRIEVRHAADPLDDNRQLAEAIHVRRLVKATAFLANIDLQAGVVTMELPKSRTSATATLKRPLAESAKITLPDFRTIDRAELKEGDLHKGDRVVVQYDTEIVALTARRSSNLSGVVQRVDAAGNVLGVLTAKDGTKEFQLAAESTVELGGATATLDELRTNDEVRITYDEGSDGRLNVVAVDAVRAIRGDRLAVVVAQQNYSDKTMPRSPFAIEDGKYLADLFRKRYGVAPERLVVLLDKKKGELEQSLGALLPNTLKGTQIIVVFLGEGFASGDKAWLAAKDFDPKNAEATGLPLSWITDQLAKGAGESLLFLDAGAAVPGADLARHPSAGRIVELAGPGGFGQTAVVAASGAEEPSLLLRDKEHSLFAWLLGEALKGAADADHDLHLTAAEFQEYLTREAAALDVGGKKQTPAFVLPE